jgi:hypothetical protein
MHTEKQLLQLAGKLALACHNVLQSNSKTLSYCIEEMEYALIDYDNAIMSNLNEKE